MASLNSLTKFESSKLPGKTLSFQDKLPKLPIPPLEDTCARYLKALQALQDKQEHETTKQAVQDFLTSDGPKIHVKLKEWAAEKPRSVIHMNIRSDL